MAMDRVDGMKKGFWLGLAIFILKMKTNEHVNKNSRYIFMIALSFYGILLLHEFSVDLFRDVCSAHLCDAECRKVQYVYSNLLQQFQIACFNRNYYMPSLQDSRFVLFLRCYGHIVADATLIVTADLGKPLKRFLFSMALIEPPE
ncbi:hypothetical protein GF337_16535 [candidate division KSB1 bacterium]|nr:hypothetical protein [candidate division KSB1 bacterium]